MNRPTDSDDAAIRAIACVITLALVLAAAGLVLLYATRGAP